MASNPPEYHLAELALARAQDDPRRSVPEIPESAQWILDIGCGAGQSLLACVRSGQRAVGVDRDLEALRLGRRLRVPALLVQASGEQLPFGDASFDFILSRVALPYMHIPSALAEAARLLRPGGRLWLALHPVATFSWRRALRHPRSAAFEIYRLLNTAALHWGGVQFRYPLRRSRIESYQTEAGMRRLLQRTGFENIGFSRPPLQLIVTARRRT